MAKVAVASCHDERSFVRMLQVLAAEHTPSEMWFGGGAIDKSGLDTRTSPCETIPTARSDSE